MTRQELGSGNIPWRGSAMIVAEQIMCGRAGFPLLRYRVLHAA